MKDEAYITLNKSGIAGIRKGKPSLRSGQVAVKIRISVSDKFFDRTIPQVDIDIPDSYIQTPSIEVEPTEGVMDRLVGEDEEK